VSDAPADPRLALRHEALLAVARRLPEPPLPEARREEMRTELLATVLGLRSNKRSRALAARGKGKRFLLAASLLFGGAGFAAAAWRITVRAAPALEPRGAALRAAGGATTLRTAEPTRAEPGAEVQPSALADAVSRDQTRTRAHHRLAMSAPGPGAPQSEAEIAFARGWRALGAGDFGAAAEAFGRAAGPRRENTLSEDACFWRAVAFDRAGRFGEAQSAFGEFLSRYPRSDRAGEASVMLGWLLLRAGDAPSAAARFGSALDDPGERVRGSAQAGLAAAGRRQDQVGTLPPPRAN